MTNNVKVEYVKFYADDIGKNISNIFNDPDIGCINVHSYWGVDIIDAFFALSEEVSFTCVSGDIRIIISSEAAPYKFKQYYLSGMDGKIVSIKEGTLFGVQSLTNNCVLIGGSEREPNITNRVSNGIFKWTSKRV